MTRRHLVVAAAIALEIVLAFPGAASAHAGSTSGAPAPGIVPPVGTNGGADG